MEVLIVIFLLALLLASGIYYGIKYSINKTVLYFYNRTHYKRIKV